MDTSLLKNPGAPYGLLPSFGLITVFVVILFFGRIVRMLRSVRRRKGEGAQKRRMKERKASKNWLKYCSLARKYTLAYRDVQRQDILYKAIVLCISCRAKLDLLSRTPLDYDFPLLSRQESKLLKLLYIAIYSGVKLPEEYLSQSFNILKRLQCY